MPKSIQATSFSSTRKPKASTGNPCKDLYTLLLQSYSGAVARWQGRTIPTGTIPISLTEDDAQLTQLVKFLPEDPSAVCPNMDASHVNVSQAVAACTCLRAVVLLDEEWADVTKAITRSLASRIDQNLPRSAEEIDDPVLSWTGHTVHWAKEHKKELTKRRAHLAGFIRDLRSNRPDLALVTQPSIDDDSHWPEDLQPLQQEALSAKLGKKTERTSSSGEVLGESMDQLSESSQLIDQVVREHLRLLETYGDTHSVAPKRTFSGNASAE